MLELRGTAQKQGPLSATPITWLCVIPQLWHFHSHQPGRERLWLQPKRSVAAQKVSAQLQTLRLARQSNCRKHSRWPLRTPLQLMLELNAVFTLLICQLVQPGQGRLPARLDLLLAAFKQQLSPRALLGL